MAGGKPRFRIPGLWPGGGGGCRTGSGARGDFIGGGGVNSGAGKSICGESMAGEWADTDAANFSDFSGVTRRRRCLLRSGVNRFGGGPRW